MPANIINSGVPLTSSATAPLWIDRCDNSTNLTNTLAPADIVIPIPGATGSGSVQLPQWVSALDQIEKVIVTGTMRGKRGDTISLKLTHEAHGSIQLLTGHAILGALTDPYPFPIQEIIGAWGGGGEPKGYVFDRYEADQLVESVTLPDGVDPNDVYPAVSLYSGSNPTGWAFVSRTASDSPSFIVVPVHRYPYAPTSNYGLSPGSGLVTGDDAIVLSFRGFRYVVHTGRAGPSIASTQQFDDIVYDNGPGNNMQGYYSTGEQPWKDFNGNFGAYASNGPFTEQLYANYHAQDWIVKSVTRLAYKYVVNIGTAQFPQIFTATRVVDTYTVVFLKWTDIMWKVYPLAQNTFSRLSLPRCIYRYYPPDYADYQALAERSESLDISSLEWKGKPADGVWTLEYSATSAAPEAAVSATVGVSTEFSPSVEPAVVKIEDLAMRIQFKGNPAYQSTALTSTVPATGVRQAVTQGTLRANGDDRALIAILCGINGSTTMGILCGYSVLRTGRTGEIYDVSYFVATTCNVQHVNLTRLAKSISYFGQDWGDRPFSTKGDTGEAFVLGSVQHRIYPVRGQIGLQVQIKGNRLTFHMLGQYPALVYQDPTVPLVTNFRRFSLNA